MSHPRPAGARDLVQVEQHVLLGLKYDRRLVVAGGVGANRQLRAALDAEGARRGFDVYYPEPELCTDNGAMIAFAAAFRIESGVRSHAFSVKPRWDLQH